MVERVFASTSAGDDPPADSGTGSSSETAGAGSRPAQAQDSQRTGRRNLLRLGLFVVALAVFTLPFRGDVGQALMALLFGIPMLVVGRTSFFVAAPESLSRWPMQVAMWITPLVALTVALLGVFAPTRRRFLIMYAVFVGLLLLSLAGCLGVRG